MIEEIKQENNRRIFERTDYVTPLNVKICKQEVIDKLLQGYTANVSSAGLLCSINCQVSAGDILWLAFDRSMLAFCQELEKRSFIYQNGVIGKVVRIESQQPDHCSVGIQFMTREEKDTSGIFPEVKFLFDKTQHSDVGETE